MSEDISRELENNKRRKKRLFNPGDKFGYLTFVNEYDYKIYNSGSVRRIICLCDCGKETITNCIPWYTGKIISCGCARQKNAASITHGMYGSELHRRWRDMKCRCNNPNTKAYRFYGAKGIKVCTEWEKFVDFKDWATKSGYKPGLSIERKENVKGYNPDNCIWIPLNEQNKNKSTNVYFTIDGVTKYLTEWAQHYNIPVSRVVRRRNLGWDTLVALTTKKISGRPKTPYR